MEDRVCSECDRVIVEGELFTKMQRYYTCNDCSGTTGMTLLYKDGKNTRTPKSMRKVEEQRAKHGADLIQPLAYNKLTRKNELNPEFSRRYGNPFIK